MKKLFTLTAIVFFVLTINASAFLNGGDRTEQNNYNKQSTCIVNGQSQSVKNSNSNKNYNTNLNKNTNVNLNKSKSKSDLEFTQVIEDEREYVNTLEVPLGSSPSGFDERTNSRKTGRKFVSNGEQFNFGNYRSAVVAKRMNKNLSKWVTSVKTSHTIMPEVEVGDHSATSGMYVFSTKVEFVKFLKDLKPEIELKDVIKIGFHFGNTTSKKGNSIMLTNQAIMGGCPLGANILLDFDTSTESEFKHRNSSTGIGGADASNAPDTVLSSILSFVFGSQKYAENPYRIGRLLRIKI